MTIPEVKDKLEAPPSGVILTAGIYLIAAILFAAVAGYYVRNKAYDSALVFSLFSIGNYMQAAAFNSRPK